MAPLRQPGVTWVTTLSWVPKVWRGDRAADCLERQQRENWGPGVSSRFAVREKCLPVPVQCNMLTGPFLENHYVIFQSL